MIDITVHIKRSILFLEANKPTTIKRNALDAPNSANDTPDDNASYCETVAHTFIIAGIENGPGCVGRWTVKRSHIPVNIKLVILVKSMTNVTRISGI